MKSIKYILIIGIVCFVISKFFVSICVVHGSSMSPTYKDKSIVLESKIITNINRNDIVVIKKIIFMHIMTFISALSCFCRYYLRIFVKKFNNK